MLGYKSLEIDFLTTSPVVSWLALIGMIALAIWLYQRTNPPLPVYLRVLLASLRILTVVALVGALLEPVVSYTRESSRRPRLAVVKDGSDSMSRVEAGLTRAARIDSLVQSDVCKGIESQTDMEFFWFSDSLRTSPEALVTDRSALGGALSQLDQRALGEPYDYWLLFTDGNSNSGQDPLSLPTAQYPPILAVNVAAEQDEFDVGLNRVDYNQIVFSGQNAEIRVKLGWNHASGERVKVSLNDQDRVLSEQSLTVEQETGFGELSLHYRPTEPGRQMLTITANSENDVDPANNSRTISLKVLKSRLSVLLVSQHPDYDLGFLKKFLDRSEKYEAELIVLDPRAGNLRGRLPSGQAEMNKYDLLVLHDIDPALLESSRDLIKSYLIDRGGAIWVQMGQEFAERGGVGWYNDLLPFGLSRPATVSYRDFRGEPEESQLFHPINRLADSRAGIRDTWASLPPFRSIVFCDQVDPASIMLVTATLDRGTLSNIPVIGFRRHGPGKLLASAAAPFWYWGFVDQGLGGDGSKYDLFLEGTLSWLTIPEDYDPIRVAPDKDVFSRGEVVRFTGLAYDQGYRAVEGATGLINLQEESTGETIETDLLKTGEGTYEAELRGVPSGTYRWSSRIEKDGSLLKENNGLIRVEKFSLEEYDQGGRADLLTALATRTGGEYTTPDAFEQALLKLDLNRISEVESLQASIWNNYWLLAIMVIALGLEWAIRKFNHLL